MGPGSLIVVGGAKGLPLTDGSVQCIVTSSPYWGLRNYRCPPVEWADGWTGELGQEPTPVMYVAHLVESPDG